MIVSWLLVISASSYADQPSQRIVSGMPSITEMLFALELDERIVGVTTNCNYPSEAKKKEKVGGFFLNLEKIVALKPDMVIMHESAQERDIQKFVEYGLPVYTMDPDTVVEVIESIEDLGRLTGTEEKAEAVIEKMVDRILAVEGKVKEYPAKKVLVIIGYNPLIVVGGGNFIDDVLGYAGAKNIASDAQAAYPQYSFEMLLEKDPDYIVIPEGTVKPEEIKNDRRWQSLSAVKNHAILFIDEDILSRPGPRVVEAIEQIAGFIHEKEI